MAACAPNRHRGSCGFKSPSRRTNCVTIITREAAGSITKVTGLPPTSAAALCNPSRRMFLIGQKRFPECLKIPFWDHPQLIRRHEKRKRNGNCGGRHVCRLGLGGHAIFRGLLSSMVAYVQTMIGQSWEHNPGASCTNRRLPHLTRREALQNRVAIRSIRRLDTTCLSAVHGVKAC